MDANEEAIFGLFSTKISPPGEDILISDFMDSLNNISPLKTHLSQWNIRC